MTATEHSIGPYTRRRARELDRSETTAIGKKALSDDASNRKSLRLNPNATSSAMGRSRPSSHTIVKPRKQKTPKETPAFSTETARAPPHKPIVPPPETDLMGVHQPIDPTVPKQPTQPGPVSPPHQTDPVSPQHPTCPDAPIDPPPSPGHTTINPTIPLPPDETNPVSPPHQTDPLPPIDSARPGQYTPNQQGPPKKLRKVSGRPKPMGCDSTGRRRSSRLMQTNNSVTEDHEPNPQPDPHVPNPRPDPREPHEPNPVPDPLSRPHSTISPQSVPSKRSESCGSIKSMIARKYRHLDVSLWRRWIGPTKENTGTAVTPGTTEPDLDESCTAANESCPLGNDQGQTEGSGDKWPPWPGQTPVSPDVMQQTQPEGSGAAQMSSDQTARSGAAQPWVFQDDGSRVCRMRRPLREVPEARSLSGLEKDNSSSGVQAGKRKRSTKRKKSDVRNTRGLAKPRDSAEPDRRPALVVVGDREFTSEPKCTKVVATIRRLTVENLPGPFRSYNMFPSRVRLTILKQFLQRYSWGEEEDELRCLDVFENIAVEAYGRFLTDVRKWCTDKIGEEESWKEKCPNWCKSVEIWKGLCDIWLGEKWEQQSRRNRDNRIRKGKEPSHVGGSRSMFRHKQAMITEKGAPVALKELFDRTHMKKTKDGKGYYCNKRSQEVMATYDELMNTHGNDMDEERVWELAVDGEDKRGRLFGFGNRSRTCKAVQELEAVEASASDPTKSTATSMEEPNRKYTREDVDRFVAESVAAARTDIYSQIADQEMRHRAELDKIRLDTKLNNARFEALFSQIGARPPNLGEGPSNCLSGGGGVSRREEDQP